MATKEKMTVEERYKYLRLVQDRYWAADKQGRSRLLSEMEEVTGLHRKSLIRLMRGKLESKRRRLTFPPKYSSGVYSMVGHRSVCRHSFCQPFRLE